MKTFVVMFSTIAMLFGMHGCMQMPTKVYKKSDSAGMSPATHNIRCDPESGTIRNSPITNSMQLVTNRRH